MSMKAEISSCRVCVEPPVRKRTLAARSVVFTMFFLCILFSIDTLANDHEKSSAEVKPLSLGLIPHLSTNLLMRKYQNLINYIEERLKRPVDISTAPDYKTYMERCAEGKFDLYMTAPHMAVYHEKNNQHIRLAKFSNELRSVVTVREDSPYASVKDLKGKKISAPDPLAVNTINGEVTLEKGGLNIGSDVSIKYSASNNNPLFLVAQKKVDAAVTGLPGYKMVSKRGKLKQPLRILKTSNPVPHMMFLSPPRVTGEDREKFKIALLDIGNHETGKAFMSGVPFGNIVEVSDTDASKLADMLSILEKRLK